MREQEPQWASETKRSWW